jgi:hypothetical protein
MWLLSAKAGIKKMRAYQKKKRTVDEIKEDDTLELLPYHLLALKKSGILPLLYERLGIEILHNSLNLTKGTSHNNIASRAARKRSY